MDLADELGLVVEGSECDAGGELGLRSWSISAATASATATVLAEGWRAMLSRTAGWPLAVTVV